MTAPAYTLPTVHLNGTSREMLLKDYRTAYNKLIEFKEAFQSIEFNARDYYIQSNTAYAEALTQRDDQHHSIGRLMQYLEAHLLHLIK